MGAAWTGEYFMLEKIVINDKIEVFGEFDTIMVRSKITVKDGGEVISETYKRFNVEAGEQYDGDCPRVQSMINALHTQEVVEARLAKITDNISIPVADRRLSPQQLAKKAEVKAARDARMAANK